MRPIIDPGYGESLLQDSSDAQARYEEWVSQNRAEAMRKAKTILAKDPAENQLPPWWWYAIGAVLAAILLGVVLLCLSLLGFIGALLAWILSPAVAVKVYRSMRRTSPTEPVANESSEGASHV
jgi:cytochrome c-type biogenesis protein CcmH/NrfG